MSLCDDCIPCRTCRWCVCVQDGTNHCIHGDAVCGLCHPGECLDCAEEIKEEPDVA